MRAERAAPSPCPREALARRVRAALALAGEIVDGLAAGAAVFEPGRVAGELAGKIVAETAMLLHAVAPRGADEFGLAREVDALARRLAPLARSADVQAALCLDAANALEHACAHVLLQHLGHGDAAFDALLGLALRTAGAAGPERLPCRRLERLWLARLRAGSAREPLREGAVLAGSAAGRPLDALQLGRDEVYAFTHAVFYASDAGLRAWPGTRARHELEADALAALGLALDDADHDLASEVLWSWPMLGLRWAPAAALAFERIAAAQDVFGVVPGRGFDPLRLERPGGAAHRRTSCYHATYVFAFLCAALLRPRAAPRKRAALVAAGAGAGAALLAGLDPCDPRSAWCAPLREAAPGRQDACAPLLLAVALRRCARAGDLGALRELLRLAQRFGLESAAVCAQAAGLLTRGTWLAGRLAPVGEDAAAAGLSLA